MFKTSKVMTAVIASLAVCQTALANPGTSAFGPGEQSTYKVRYLGLTAGEAQITVGAETTQWGHRVLPIVTHARSKSITDLYPIRDKFVTYWDHAREQSVGSDLYADENRQKRRQRIRFDHAAGRAKVVKQKEGGDERLSEHDIQQGAFDIASATFALRNKALEVGKVIELPVFTGNRMFTMRATVEGRETLKTALGNKEVFKIRVQTGFSGKFESKRDLYAYLTADDARIPVRIEAEFVLGTISAELSDYKSGRRYALGPAVSVSEGSGGG